LGEEEQLWRAEPEVQRALAVIARASSRPVETLRAADNLELDLTLDSMQRVELVVALEEALETEIAETALAAVYTVRELVDVARSSMGKATGKLRRSNWETVLATEPEDPQVQAALKPRPFITLCGFVLTRFLSIFQKIFFRFEVSGLENLPKDGPYIIAPNHQSLIDPVSLVCVLRWGAFRKLFAVGTSEIFGGGLMRLLASTLKTIPVDPDANLVNAMRAAAAGLRRGRILILYPEGERSIDGTPKIFRKGAAILATHLKVPIVPVAHEGYYDAWPRGLGFQKFSKLRLRFGKPIVVDAQAPASDKFYEEVTTELRGRVVAMWEDLRKQKS
jgi:long-chain acyl-CoA synthetase